MCGGARALIDPATDLAALAEPMPPATRSVDCGPDRTHYADPLAKRLKSLSRD